MEIILLENILNLGNIGDKVTVKNGYGRNFLIPQGFAILATSSSKKVLAENIKQREFKEKKLIDEAKKVAKKLNKLEIKIPTKCGKGGKLFGSISNVNLNNELTNAGFEFDKKIIKVQGGLIKRLGNYSATIRLHRDVINEISFEVVKSQE